MTTHSFWQAVIIYYILYRGGQTVGDQITDALLKYKRQNEYNRRGGSAKQVERDWRQRTNGSEAFDTSEGASVSPDERLLG